MTPDPAARLGSVARALQHVVLPALPADETLAQKQARLCLGHVAMLIEQYRHLADYDALCLTAMVELATRLAEQAAGGPRTDAAAGDLRAAVSAASDPSDTAAGAAADARTRRNAVAAAVDDLLRAGTEDATAEFRATSHQLVLDHGIRQAYRDRVWFRASGLDPEQATFPEIAQLLHGTTASP